MASKPVRATIDSQMITGAGIITAVVLTSGTAVSSALLYDNTAASGTVLADLYSLANNSTVLAGLQIAYSKGVYLDITGTGSPSVMVYVE